MCQDCNDTGRVRESRRASSDPYSQLITVYGPCWCSAGAAVEAASAVSDARDRAARDAVEDFLYGKRVAA
jgi:hypothetical protein